MCSKRCCGKCASCCVVFLLVLPWVPAFLSLCRTGRAPRTLLPYDLPGLLLFKGKHQTRTLGLSPTADRSAYKDVILTEEQKAHYFTHGYVIIRNCINPDMLGVVREDLYKEIGPASYPWAHSSFMTVDSVLDFYMFSNLGSIASQIFGSSDSDIKGRIDGTTDRASAHLWSDFHYFRPSHGAKVINPFPYHSDALECDAVVPANHTKRSRLRYWITLDDDVMTVPVVNQTYFLSLMNASEQEQYWAGTLPGLSERLLEQWADEGRLNSTMDPEIWTTDTVNRGDLLIHSPCLVHTSPPPPGRQVALICVTYAPGESKVFNYRNAGAPVRSCNRRGEVGDTIKDRWDPCTPQVYPPHENIHKGAELHYEARYYNWFFAYTAWNVHKLFQSINLGGYSDLVSDKLEL